MDKQIILGLLFLALFACKSSKVAESNKADAANAKTEIKGPNPATATAVAATTETGKIKTDETSYTKSGQDETVINFKGLEIHPDRFTTLECERLGNSIGAYKSYNHEFFALATYNKEAKSYHFQIINKKGEIKYEIELTLEPDNALQRCHISPNGEFVHFESIIPFMEQQGYIIQSYQNGQLVYQADSISTYEFNNDKNILIYFKVSQEGVLNYKNYLTYYTWEKRISEKLTYTAGISNNGKSLLLHSIDKHIGVSGNGDLLWNKDKSYFNANIRISNKGEHLIILGENSLEVYSFDNLSLILTKTNSELTGVNNYKYIAAAVCLDEKKLIFCIVPNYIKVYNFEGILVKEIHDSTINQYFDVFEEDKTLRIQRDGKSIVDFN